MKIKPKHRVIAVFLILNFLQTFVPYNYLLANNNGPNAPEAASFEPVDATDMVNLATGDFTYVLPLLNVPSPEGGYPLALAYHSGIAMDQEASWTGLGWNLNPGAINRNINGYPDDYNSALLTEFFYDEGGTQSMYSLSVGYSNGVSVGVGLSWGSHRSLGGSVSVGIGLGGGIGIEGEIGTDGASVGISAGIGGQSGQLSLGASISTNGNVSGSIGFNSNGEGFSIGFSNQGSYSFGITDRIGNKLTGSLGVSFSSSGVGISGSIRNTVTGGGVGLSTSFNNSVSMGDYTVKSSGFNIPLYVPTPIGVFSLSFGKQRIRYYLGQVDKNHIEGPLYFYDGVSNGQLWEVECISDDPVDGPEICGYLVTNDYNEALDFKAATEDPPGDPYGCYCTLRQIQGPESFMDIHEISPLMAKTTDAATNNLTFPNFDKFNVQAQGISGNISPRIFENGALFGLDGKENDQGYTLGYEIDGLGAIPDFAKFDDRPNFYFDNEISSYLDADVSSANFFSSGNFNDIEDYYSNGVQLAGEDRRTTSNYIEYYTNGDILDNYTTIKSEGYLNADVTTSTFDRSTKPRNGIGAFKITAADGKTFHYSLPVYNEEIITRTFGIIKEGNDEIPKEEDESYFEKRQLEPYATHWLLTAVTGPDYIDENNDGIANQGDYGYWTSFSYGKWSEAFVWKNPYDKDYIESESDENSGTKTWIRGRKELFYLNTVSTRTHTAVFVKEESPHEESEAWTYRSVVHANVNQTNADYVARFTIPAQKQLRLAEVLLLKNEDATAVTTHGPGESGTYSTVNVKYNNSVKENVSARYNYRSNTINKVDMDSELYDKALKVIDMLYEPLVYQNNKSGLSKVVFKGKGGVQTVPSYKFKYNDLSYIWDINKKDEWGYFTHDNSLWSLNEIQTPQGGKIKIDYDQHEHYSAVDHNFYFTNYTKGIYTSTYPTYSHINDVSNKKLEIQSNANLVLNVGDKVWVNYEGKYPPLNGQGVLSGYNGWATVTTALGINRYEVTFDNDMTLEYGGSATNIPLIESYLNGPNSHYFEKFYRGTEVRFNTANKVLKGGGVRVTQIATEDGSTSYKTEYKYGENEDGIGYVSYIPFAHELEEEVPYSAELPSPKVMYEYVTTKSVGDDDVVHGKTVYKFNVLKDRTGTAEFGNFYEIDTDFTTTFTNSTANKEVNISNFTVKDNLASIGQLLEVKTYNSENQPVQITKNEYFSPEETPSLVGMTKESYQTYKSVDYSDATKTDKWIVNSSTRIKYPNLLKSTTSISNGVAQESEFTQFNPVNGMSDEIITKDSKGVLYKTVNVPAYQKYPDMGSKVANVHNRNMLTQNAANYSFVDDNGTWRPIGVGITTWSNNWIYTDYRGIDEPQESSNNKKVWRKDRTYIWDGDIDANGRLVGFDTSNDDGFNWAVGANQPNPWKKVSTITKYNHFSEVLEVKDINNNYATTRTTDKESKVLLTSNARYGEAIYTSAEYDNLPGDNYLDHDVFGLNFQTDEKSHTGEYSVKIGPGGNSVSTTFGTVLRANQFRAGEYKISAWIHKDNYTKARIKMGWTGALENFNGERTTAGNWVLMNHYFDISQAQTNSNQIILVTSEAGDIFIDDFRILPVASSMTSYVYNDKDELTFILGPNNLATKYQYDASGKLIRVYQETANTASITGGFKKAVEYKYNYQRGLDGSSGGGGGCQPEPVYFDDFSSCVGLGPSSGVLRGPIGTTVTYAVQNQTGGDGTATLLVNGVPGSGSFTITAANQDPVFEVAYVPGPSNGQGAATVTITAVDNECYATLGQSLTISDNYDPTFTGTCSGDPDPITEISVILNQLNIDLCYENGPDTNLTHLVHVESASDEFRYTWEWAYMDGGIELAPRNFIGEIEDEGGSASMSELFIIGPAQAICDPSTNYGVKFICTVRDMVNYPTIQDIEVEKVHTSFNCTNCIEQ
ncbi:MAG: hypothetical protein AAFP76_00060 [Bacteroidota bacterium]